MKKHHQTPAARFSTAPSHGSVHEAHGHDDVPSLLRAAGLRVTQVRVAVMESLARTRVAMSAADVIEALETSHLVSRDEGGRAGGGVSASRKREPVDKVTVYRTLNALVDANLAHKIDPGDRVFRYSLTDHARCTGEHHDHEHPHVICERCGVVECLDDAEVLIRPRSGAHRDGAAGKGHGHNEPSAHARKDASAAADAKTARPGDAAAWSADTPLHRFKITRQEITLRGICEKCTPRLR